jgi:hypothetical protein
MSVNRDGDSGKAAIKISEPAEVKGGTVKSSKECIVARRTPHTTSTKADGDSP